MKRKENVVFIGLFSAVVLIVFSDLATLKIGFLKGDYLQQFFPWYQIYAENIKSFKLPLWSSSFQSGFPLFAEGQIGALYPLNLLFYFIFPFKFAYNYSFLIHFILAGFFTYLYARKIQCDFWGGFLASVLLCFGSAYAGLFVNVSALKSLAWFPLVLLLYENYLESGKKGLLLLIGLILGMQLLAGSFQMTAYAFIFYAAYFIHKSHLANRRLLKSVTDILILFSIALLISLPQLIATFQLTSYSNRIGQDLGFALWNSLSIFSLIGVFLPSTGSIFSRGDIIFIGVLSLFFAYLSIYLLKQDKKVNGLIFLFILSFFLALGKYNPVYLFLIKIFKFYSFRSPSRFLYFSVFALSVLAGRGFTHFFNVKNFVPETVYKSFISLSLTALGVFITVKLILRLWGSRILALGEEYAAKHIFGAANHRYSLETYLAKTSSFYDLFVRNFSFYDPWVISGIIFLISAIFMLYLTIKFPTKKSIFKFIYFIFICAELIVFSLYAKGIRRELTGFDTIVPKETKILNILRQDKNLFRILPFGNVNDMPLWLRPCMNAYFSLDSVAFYSPLANREYYLKTKDLGIVDDSLGIVPPSKENLYKNMNLIRSLNVKYIISTLELDPLLLDTVERENGFILYKMREGLPRVFFVGNDDTINSNQADIRIEEYHSGFTKIDVANQTGGVLVFSENFYPGWTVNLDGKITKIEKFMDIIQLVRIPVGRHKVVFEYRLDYLKILLPLQAAFFLIILFSGLFYANKRNSA